MPEATPELTQKLVNALSRGLRYIDQATRESFRADEVYAEALDALADAEKAGFRNNVKERDF